MIRKLGYLGAVIGLSVTLGGCPQITNDWNAITGSAVSPTAVIVAGNSFDALEATATNYLRLKKCSSASGPICRDPKATAMIIPAIRSGRAARTNLEQFMVNNPGKLGDQGLYNALQTAITTLKQAFSIYGIS